ncbi:glycoside hydrolase family 5 protein [Microbacterium sp. YY-01]|uniref:glycoside hydrolase family 5 protein n=1 Tax=Microbacterium sp. YY-01 TaxID=3421634 RepID=UPI003D16A90A
MRVGGRTVIVAIVTAVVVAGGLAATLRSTPEATTEFFRDADGRSLVQHGFSTASSAKSTPDGLPLFTEEDLTQERLDMNTNFVRFLISWRAVEPQPGEIDETYLDAVEERVGWYADLGYHVMLDMHQDLWGWGITPDKQRGNGAPEWATYMDGLPVEDQEMWELVYLEPGVIRAFDHFWGTTGKHPELVDHYAGAWQAVAERFADNDTVVAYDLMNEPYGGTLQGVAFESGPLTDLYQRTANAIREVDSDTWLCLEPQAFGFNWGLPSSIGTIDDAREGEERVAFCPHLYPLPMDLGDGYEGSSKQLVRGTIDVWTKNVLRTADMLGKGDGPVPVILGEFGLDTTRNGADEYVDRVYRMADTHGFGVAYWSRDSGSWGPYETDGTARNLVSWLDRPYPRAAWGLISWHTDGAALTLELDGTTGGGDIPIEIHLPARPSTYPVVEGGTVITWEPTTGTLGIQPDDGATVVTVRQ